MQHPFRNAATCFLLMLTLCVLFTCNMWAQGGSGELSGVVTDPSGAVVPNAQITLSNTATGDKRTTVTTGAGIYRFSALPVVGTYTLEAYRHDSGYSSRAWDHQRTSDCRGGHSSCANH